jgi:hypothetical protein
MNFSLKKKKSTSRQIRAKSAVEAPTYRRNRTMTDRSTVPEVSARARGVVIAIAISQFSGSVVVVNTDTTLTKPIELQAYQKLFVEYYRKHPLERFRFMTDHARLLAWLQHEMPEVQAVHPAGTQGFGVSRYEIIARTPVAGWVVDDKRYYVDAAGATFTENHYQEPRVSVVDNSGARVEQGAAIASGRLLSFVGRVIALSSEQGVTIDSIEIPVQSTRLVYLKGKGMPVVRMTIDRVAAVQVNDMVAALTFLKKAGRAVEYIDVRVEGKAFYQ